MQSGSCIIEEGLGDDTHAAAGHLLEGVTDDNRATWRASRPIDWANESFAISIVPEVEYCVTTSSGCWYETQNARLDQGEPERTVLVDRAYIEIHTRPSGTAWSKREFGSADS
jgi:hypothetical protein